MAEVRKPTRPTGQFVGPKYEYLTSSDEEKAFGLFQLMSDEGKLVHSTDHAIDKQLALQLYRGMQKIRIVDARMMALQRQGRIGFYGEALGQEAAVVGAAAAMQPQDWLIPALREAGAGLYRGLTLDSYIAQIFGNAADVTKGRQMPCHPCDKETNYVVMSSCVSSQIPHAVGIAWGMKIKGGSEACCVGFMGDGGTSEGEFHVALNFAGVSKVPVVLICQNNQWAISTPGKKQTASETIAIKGLGYGVESLRADGNDVLAVYEICRYATEKARRGDGPTFIELLTYRVSAHSSSDDPSRYRDESITEDWKTNKDPLKRMNTFLSDRGWLDADEDLAWQKDYEAQVRAAIARQEEIAQPRLETIVDDVFEEVPWHLKEQLAEIQ